MHNHRKRVAYLAVKHNIQLYKLAPLVADKLVIEACIPARARFYLVEKVENYLVEGQIVLQLHPTFVKISHSEEGSALFTA